MFRTSVVSVHRINCFGELSTAFLVNTTRVQPHVSVSSIGSNSTASLKLLLTSLCAPVQVYHVFEEYFPFLPTVRQNSVVDIALADEGFELPGRGIDEPHIAMWNGREAFAFRATAQT